MKFAILNVVCDKCGKVHKEQVRVWDPQEYAGSILKSYWCNHCREPQAIRYQFVDGAPTVVKHLECSAVFAPKEPETGITIRPRQGHKH